LHSPAAAAARWALDEQIKANKNAFKRLPRNRGGLFGAGCWEDKVDMERELPEGMLDPFARPAINGRTPINDISKIKRGIPRNTCDG